MRSGIYQIRNLINNKIYVGSAKDLSHRRRCHFSMLLHNKHSNKHLQSAYNMYGKENLVFEELITCDPSMCLWYEQQFLDQWNPEYNIYKIAGSNHSNIPTEQQRKDQSARMLGNNYKFGKKESEETRNRKSIFHSTEEELKRLNSIVQKHWKGKHHSEETKIKMKLAWEIRRKNKSNTSETAIR